MKIFLAAIATLALSLTLAGSLRADTIVFKNGEELDGTVLEKDDTTIKLEVEYGTVLVPMARVRRIDPETPEQIEERAKKKAAAIEFEKQMKEEGKVRYKGKWVAEEEKKADEEKIAEAKKKKRAAEEVAAAKKKADDAAAKIKADAAFAAQQNQNNTNSRNDRFSSRHNRDSNNNNSNYGNSNNGYGNNNNGNNYSTVLNNSGYRGGY